MLDLYNREFWQGINPDSTITLKDQQAIEDSVEKGRGMKGMDYMVRSVYHLKELDSFAEWYFFLLDDPEGNLWLMVKIVDQQVDLRIYFEHPQFEPGNRKDMIDQENLWLFMEPDDPVDFQYNDLKFTDFLEIEQESDQALIYHQKGFKEMHCRCELKPALSGITEFIATIVEYKTKTVCENPELLLFELGGEDSEDGGLIRLMIGCSLRPTEIDILEA